jgi:hypothetical protein
MWIWPCFEIKAVAFLIMSFKYAGLWHTDKLFVWPNYKCGKIGFPERCGSVSKSWRAAAIIAGSKYPRLDKQG